MPKKLQNDDADLMKIFEHYAELRREHADPALQARDVEFERGPPSSSVADRTCDTVSSYSDTSENRIQGA